MYVYTQSNSHVVVIPEEHIEENLSAVLNDVFYFTLILPFLFHFYYSSL